jgi:hypothetical protein
VRRLLLRQRLYGTKVGSMWAIFPNNLEAFKHECNRQPLVQRLRGGAAARRSGNDMDEADFRVATGNPGR